MKRRVKNAICLAKVMLRFDEDDMCSFYVEAPVDGVEFTEANTSKVLAIGLLQTVSDVEEAIQLIREAAVLPHETRDN